MDVAIELCTRPAYAALIRGLGGVEHSCPVCGSASHGAPRIARGYISISHSDPLHVVALADEPVGVDAEPTAAGDGIESVALHPAERAPIEALNGAARRRAVLETWVAKEAALKLAGCGLQIAPESFVVRHAGRWYVEAGAVSSSTIHVSVTELDGHTVAVATHRLARLAVRRRDGLGEN